MSETYIITAKTVDEAIAIANREYADADHEVAYDIIDMPKKGFLGIGARDAKIKITVSKVQKVELGSLVDDIRSMKTLTDRGGSRTQKQPKPAQPKPQNAQKPAQSAEKPAQQNAQKTAQTQNAAKQKSAQQPVRQKPADKSAEKPAQQKNAQQPVRQKPAEKSAEKPAQPKKAEVKQNQPKLAEKSAEKSAEKPQKPVEKQPKAEAKADMTAAKTETKSEPVQPQTEAKAEKTYTSHLGNEVKRTRRPERKPQNTENIPASGVTVSSPVGLSDFSGTKTSGFGSGDYTGGRISNDIKKKPQKPNVVDPAKANRDALKALTFDVDAHEKAKPEETAPVVAKAEKPQRSERPAKQPKPQSKPADKSAQKPAAKVEDKYPESNLIKKDAPAAEEKRLVEGVTQAEMDFALDFANTLLENMKLDAKAVPADANGEEYIINGDANVYPRINIIGADTGILIGHHGETLDAIQYLVNLSVLRKSKQKDGDLKIVVDIEGYREKREETLRTLARRMAARAVKYKRNVFLEPMNAYERRIIHSELQSFENVSTHSVGADKDRKIIITYEGPDKRRPQSENSADVSAKSSVENEERKRPKKPVKLPIDKLTDLLESREDGYAAPATAEEATVSVSEEEEAKAVIETESVEVISESEAEEAEAAAETVITDEE